MTTKSETTGCACGAGESAEAQFIDALVRAHEGKPGSLIPILQSVQKEFGHLSEASLRRISDGLGEPLSKVFGVVTFYSYFARAPRGKNLVRVCMGTACYIKGAQQVLEAFENRLGIKVGQTTTDRMFTVEVARCFGACGLAPAVSVNDKVYKNVAPSAVGGIVDTFYQNTGEAGVAA